MTTISTTSSGTSYVSGLISGIDTNALIEAAVNARLKKADRIDDVIDTNTTKISAFQNLQTYTQDLLDALESLKSSSSASSSAFDAKQVTSRSSSSTSADNILEASVTSSATAGTYRIVVQQLAQAMSVTGDTQTSSSAALGYSGSFDIALEGNTASTITITADMSLSDIADAINATSSGSGIQANLLQTGSGVKLVLTGTDTAKAIQLSNATGDDILQGLGITDSNGDFAHISQTAQQAIITFNGTTIESDTNTLENVLGGLTLDLNNADSATTITLTVGNNTEGVQEAIQTFIDSYNTLRNYLAQNQEITDGAISSYAYLYGEATIRSMMQELSSAITGRYGNSDYNSLGSLGITLNTENELVLDSDQLSTALENHFTDIAAFFATTTTTTGLADTLHTLLDRYANESTGSIQKRIDALTTSNSGLTTESDRIRERAEIYQNSLIEKYATMEASIQYANIVKQQIEALMNSSSSSDDS